MTDEEQRLIEVAKRTGIQGIYIGLKQIYPLGIEQKEIKVIPPKKLQGKMDQMARSQQHLAQIFVKSLNFVKDHVCGNFYRVQNDATFEYCKECHQRWYINRRRAPHHLG